MIGAFGLGLISSRPTSTDLGWVIVAVASTGMLHPPLTMAASNVFDRCATCGSQLESPLRCSRCKTSIYCNRECQTKHWSEHKRLCRPVASLAEAQAKPRQFKERMCRDAYKSFPHVQWVACATRQSPIVPAPNLLIMLHGTGDSEAGFAKLAASMAIPGS